MKWLKFTGFTWAVWMLIYGQHAYSQPALKKIHEVQGESWQSPLKDQQVVVEGIVTLVRSDSRGIKGYFLQTPATQEDGNRETSEGIFIKDTRSNPPAVNSLIKVTGTVKENYGNTEIQSVSAVEVVKAASEHSFVVRRPVINQSTEFSRQVFETMEGMLVKAEGLMIGGNYNGVTLVKDILYKSTQKYSRGPQAEDHANQNKEKQLKVERGGSEQGGSYPFYFYKWFNGHQNSLQGGEHC